MLKKVGVVVAAAFGLSLVATPAIASAQVDTLDVPAGLAEAAVYPTFGDAYNSLILGGGALGYGTASLVAGAYTGIATTPALIVGSMVDDD